MPVMVKYDIASYNTLAYWCDNYVWQVNAIVCWCLQEKYNLLRSAGPSVSDFNSIAATITDTQANDV